MTTTTVLGVIPDRVPVDLLELKNSSGWAPSIWSRLLLHRGENEYGWLRDDPALHTLWKEIEDLPAWQQVPLLLTFDTGVLPAQEFRWAAAQLTLFESKLPERREYANHVPTVAGLLRQQPEVPLLGVYGTSVSNNPFYLPTYDDEGDEIDGTGIPLEDMYVLNRHREIVDEMFAGVSRG